MADGRREWLALGRAMLPARVLGPLLERCGSARALLDAPPGQLGLKEGELARLRQGVEQAAADEAALAKCGAVLLARGDDRYPPLLREIHDPPVVLYVRGTLPPGPAVAIVGSRRSTPYGRMVAHSLGQGLAAAGVTVVSGLARGIDAAAHEGALAAGGPTVAVLGCGIDRCYPHDHAPLADRIATMGAVISEFPPGLAPAGWHFPLRNRIISGLSLGVVVVEAPAKSGALITANLALEQGREVFAVPGSVNSEQARGSHQLLKDGARLVESVEDILDELNLVPSVGQELASCPASAPAAHAPVPRPAPAPSLPAEPALPPAKANDPLLNHLSLDPVGLEDLQAATGMPAGELSAKLLLLELQGVVGRLPGNRLIRLK